MKKTILRVLGFALVLALTLTCFGCSSGSAGDKELVIFSWEGYIDPELLTEFTEQTGIKINYNYFNSPVSQTPQIVKVFPLPVTPSSTWCFNPSRTPWASWAIAWG